MTETQSTASRVKRFRSPPYPAFDLEKAVERAALLFEKAHHYQVGASVLSEAWRMESSSGKVWRHAAALIQYGLLSDSGTGESRKFQITDAGRRIVQDNSPSSEKRKAALQTAALAPMIHGELWGKYQAAKGLSDSVLKTYLTTDRAEKGEAPYSSSAAEEVVNTYRSTLAFAGLTDSASAADTAGDKDANTEQDQDKDEHIIKIAKIGDFIKWTSGGVDQFASRKVEWVSDDNSHLRVFGSPTGIPMSEVEIVEPPEHQTQNTPNGTVRGRQTANPKAEISVYQVGGRLQITADVDLDGIEKLEGMLAKYKEILKLLN